MISSTKKDRINADCEEVDNLMRDILETCPQLAESINYVFQ